MTPVTVRIYRSFGQGSFCHWKGKSGARIPRVNMERANALYLQWLNRECHGVTDHFVRAGCLEVQHR